MNAPVNKPVGITPWFTLGTAEQWVTRIYALTGLLALLAIVLQVANDHRPNAGSTALVVASIALWITGEVLERWQARARTRARDEGLLDRFAADVAQAKERGQWDPTAVPDLRLTLPDLTPEERAELDNFSARPFTHLDFAAPYEPLKSQPIGHWRVVMTPGGLSELGSYDAVMAAYRNIGRSPEVNSAAIDTALALEIAQELDARLTDLRIRFDNNRAPEAWQAAAATLYDLFTTLGHTPAIVMNQHTLFPPPVEPLPERPGTVCDDRR